MGMYVNEKVVDVAVLFWTFSIDVRFSEHELSQVVVKFLNIFELAFARTYSFDVVNPSTAVISFGSALVLLHILLKYYLYSGP